MNNIIQDGMNEPGYIAERKGLFDAVRFTYRPMLHEERTGVNQLIALGGIKGTRAIYSAIHKHVVEWDIKGPDGKTVELSLANVAKARPMLVEAFYNIISGWLPSDPDPTASPDAAGEETDISMAAWLAEQTEAETKLRADAKN